MRRLILLVMLAVAPLVACDPAAQPTPPADPAAAKPADPAMPADPAAKPADPAAAADPSKPADPAAAADPSKPADPAAAADPSKPADSVAGNAATPPAEQVMTAELGKPAPDFKLKDLNGAEVSLSSFKGKVVVLEWFNPGCPFVKAAHGEGALKDMAKKHPEVVWLAINSNAPGKEGHGLEVNKEGAKGFGMEHPVLLDEDGKVGKLYGAQRTPHMYVVDKDGNLAYRGALDNSGSGLPKDANPYVNHIEDALKNLAEGKPVATPDTKAWGCSVKYGG